MQEESPSYVEFICGKGGVIDTWLNRGASGFRLDVADELPDDFIEKIRAAVKSHGEDKLLLGEVWEDATTKEAFGRRRTYLRGHGLDAVMNYPFRSATLDYLHGADVTAVADALMQICEHYPAPALNCAMNFLSTHDTERAITAIAGEPCNNRDRYWQSKRVIPSGQMDEAIRRLLLGYAMIFTLPGVPCVYYGDEIAMQGYRDPFNRAFFDWNSTEQRLRGPIKTLAALRRSCDAFDGGRLEIVRAEGDILHYRRVGVVQTAEIILNRGPHLIAEEAFGKNTEVNPGGFTVLVEDNHPEHVGYFSVYYSGDGCLPCPSRPHPFIAVCRGRACPARSLTLTPFSALHPFSPPHPSKISLAKSPSPRYNTLKVKGSKGRAPAARRIASSPRVACRPGAYCEH